MHTHSVFCLLFSSLSSLLPLSICVLKFIKIVKGVRKGRQIDGQDEGWIDMEFDDDDDSGDKDKGKGKGKDP